MALSGWAAKKTLLIIVPSQSSALSDFPILINLSASSGTTSFDCSVVFDELGTNSKKIAVEDVATGNECYVEIENWESDNAQLHVKVPTILTSGARQLKLYYDSTHADNTTYIGDAGSSVGQNVWDSNFVAVYHLCQDPSVGGACVLDSTSNGNDGTPNGTMTTADLVDGLVGKGLDFDGVNDYIAVPHSTEMNSNDQTVECLFLSNSGTISDSKGLVFKAPSTSATREFGLQVSHTTGYVGGTISSGSATETVDTAGICDGDYHIVALVKAYDAGGDTFSIYEDGAVADSATVAYNGYQSTNEIVIGKLSSSSTADRFFNHIIGEVRVSDTDRSADWIEVTNLSLTDGLLSFSSPYLQSEIDQAYGDLTTNNLALENMPYALLFPLQKENILYYSIKLGTILNQYYGDADVVTQVINQYYSDSPEIQKQIVMLYEDMLTLTKATEMPYNILDDLQKTLTMPYALAGDALLKLLDQHYGLLTNNLLQASLAQIYMLQHGNTLSSVDVSAVVSNGVTPDGEPITNKTGDLTVNSHHVDIEYSIDSFVCSAEIHLADESEYAQIRQGDNLLITINGETHTLIVETTPRRMRAGIANSNYIVTAVSPAIRLSAPWCDTFTCSFADDTAQNIFEALADPLTVDWQIVNFPISGLQANDDDKISIMRLITQSAGAIIQSDPDGGLRVVYKYPDAVNTWPDVTAAYFLTDSINFISQDETPLHNDGTNKYVVSNTTTPQDRVWAEQADFDVLAFEVPWKGSTMTLDHTGSDDVGEIEYMGIVEETIIEQVEFVAGFSRSERPIYDLIVDWIEEDLGTVDYLEDGTLEALTKDGTTEGYSLADITYTTKYHLWKVDNSAELNVQYILRVEGYEQDTSQSSC